MASNGVSSMEYKLSFADLTKEKRFFFVAG
jgi:hypothetical protein